MTWNRPLATLLSLKFLALVLLALSGYLSLAPDEAQYWTWSQELDFGYYSKPPAIAWQIALTTFLLGNNELGVRLGSLFLGCLLSYVLYQLALSARCSQKTAFWAAVCFAVSPLGVYLSFAATTDVGATFFLTLALWMVVRGPHYISAGFCILIAALYKWVAFMFWPFIIVAALFFPFLRKKSLLWGILLSLLAFLPSLYWNITHDFATFRHVYNTVSGTARGNFFDFLGAQIALFSPIFFILLIYAFFHFRKLSSHVQFLALFVALSSLYLLGALFQKMQPNWGLYLYPSAFIVLSLTARRLWLLSGALLSLIGIIGALLIPLLPLPYRLNPFRQNMGWKQLAPALHSCGYDSKKDFTFGDKYQMASLLSFYGPDQKRAYFFNLGQSRKNQFSYWPQMQDKEVGHTGYFVIAENRSLEELQGAENHYLQQLAPYFKNVAFCGFFPLFGSVKYALLFKATDYNGLIPKEITKY